MSANWKTQAKAANHDGLKAKCDTLAQMSDSAKGYVHAAIGAFVNDPPDTDYQRGYLAALLNVYLEGFNMQHDETTKEAERLPRKQTTT